ncbi:BREX-2 system adenine-specific DNA-methyltransferase PglX [Actinomadura sp. WMMA1423]|uniref:BREX-2 system adenine-specific DNA-methyltransferase PglX n=1 Tax=Actinomadura sp. WMMA1423 TaxID=2591108 RepID=UPI00114739A6|nr:BREX-2 system adenine-specific DNA-methyltransferase PglX [Actinomadura sp. WMMA1423]
MIDRKALLADLKKQVGALEGDLRERAADDGDIHARLYGEWQQARAASRIAATYESWLDDRVTQAAVAWVLGTVFLRFCEDNGLIEVPFLAGPGERLDLAQERQADYIRQHPHDTDRDWILAGFGEMSRSPVAAGLFDRAHNPMWQIEIPHHAAKALLAFWRRRSEDGEIVHDFTDPEWDTRFLGDLYQYLSIEAQEKYALLQTPEFVEEFILDRTLELAVDSFGLRGLRVIDPTCGSGHFLLGAFNRIFRKWQNAERGANKWDHVRLALLSVHGVDKNPFATGIARFRLLVAAMRAGEVSSLAGAPDFPIVIATGDSLLHGRGAPGIQADLISQAEPHVYATEDIYDYVSAQPKRGVEEADLLGVGSYHVVVGNPPYITPSDAQESLNYRAYSSCYREYQLSVPFAERFFQLAVRGEVGGSPAGYVGQITSNGFAKRDFGRKLVNDFLPTVDLSLVIDTSGAFIPGHGTPTVILIGQRRWPKETTPVRTVMGIRGEPREPADPSRGNVWQAIANGYDEPGFINEWVSVADVAREVFRKHPWSLGGGGATDLIKDIESAAHDRLRKVAASIGYTGQTNADDAFLFTPETLRRLGVEADCWRAFITGDDARDYQAISKNVAIFPYREEARLVDIDMRPMLKKLMWPNKTRLWARATFGRSTYRDQGRSWWEWHQVAKTRLGGPVLTWPFVQTHNHFAYLPSCRLHNRHAPVIQLSREATEEEYVQLLGLLNSSVACFWLKQVCHNKGAQGVNEGFKSQDWERFFEFAGNKFQDFPLPENLPLAYSRALNSLAAQLLQSSPASVIEDGQVNRRLLDKARDRWEMLQGRMIALQEELDWECYTLYELLGEKLTVPIDELPAIRLGERAFEIVLARKIERGEYETEWFNRHESTPVTEIPEHWPENYRQLVEKRIEIIELRRDIALIERPECKRRWATEPWEKQEKSALRSWLLDRCEGRSLWFKNDEYGVEQPQAMTVNQLADQLRRDEDFVSVARLYADDDAELAKVVAEIVQDEHVPHLAVLRYKDPSGLRKRAQWEDVWEQQREEDRTGKRLDIPVPPKYTSADFLKTSYWRNRGKLDVPKERFISYPGSGPDGDSSMLLGWAGWDHREQGQALMTLIEERATQDGWDAARLTPLLASLAEVLPWVRQWHGEVDPAFGQSPADAYGMYLEDKQRTYGISDDDLKNWRPEKPKRGGFRKKTS